MLIYGVGILSTLVCFCALLFDVGLFEKTRAQMQNAADAAAIGAVFNYNDGGTLLNGAVADAGLNGFTNGSGNVNVTMSNPAATGAYAGNPYAVQVRITKTVAASFLPKSVSLAVTSTAMRVPTPCIYMLSKVSTAVSFLSNNQTNQYTCPTYLGRSYNLAGATSSGSQYFVASNSTGSTGTPTPAAIFGAPTLVDPLAYLPSPPVGPCKQTNYVVSSSMTLDPGTYCGGLTINTNSSVTLNPGMYVLTGPLTINGPNLTGNGVTFYVTTSGSGSSRSSIQNVNAMLSAPKSGIWQGILFYTDRSLVAGQGNLSMSNWNPGTTLDGILYLPNQVLTASNIPLKAKRYLGIVADSSHMNNVGFSPAADYSTLANGNPFHPVGGGGGLVE